MPHYRFAAMSASLLLVLGGCSGSSSTTNHASNCSFTAPIPGAPSPASADASIEVQAEAKQLSALDGIFGQYLRGDTHAYRGTVQARDTYVTIDSDGGSIPEGAAIASLAIEGSLATLIIHNTSQHEYVWLQQSKSQPGLTQVGVILGDNSVGGDIGTCSGCAPDFFGAPASLSIRGLISSSAQSEIGADGGNVPYTVQTFLTASLDLSEPCSLELADLTELASPQSLPRFGDGGSDLVWHVQDQIITQGNPCELANSYTIDLFVNPSNLADYGVRNFVAQMATPECPGTAKP
jgi:hypothetical protein